MDKTIDLPLLRHATSTVSAFTPEALVSAVRNARNLPEVPVPDVCLLDFDGDLTDLMLANGQLRSCECWACFHSTMYLVDVNGRTHGLIPRTIGGPYSVLIAEQLRASGARLILGLTSAGRVSPAVPIPSLVVATAAIRDEGTSYHYLPPAERVSAPVGLAECLALELRSLRTPLFEGLLWTTDAPYRETLDEIRHNAAAGALAVEMQAASLFAFGAARDMPVGVVGQVSNAVDYTGEPFDKGPEIHSIEVFDAMCRAGVRYLSL